MSQTVTITLTLGQVAIIDAADLQLVSGRSWHARKRRDGKGFYAAAADGTRMHRLLMNAPPDKIVDHRDGDGLNNRRSNLRVGTQSLNCVNRQRTPGPYLRGVQPKKRKWRAQIRHQGKMRNLGYFNTEEEAHAAYIAESRRLYGDWQPLPSPPGKGGETQSASFGPGSHGDTAVGTIISMGWDEHDDERVFVARVKFPTPPPWPFAVVWKALPVRVSVTDQTSAARRETPEPTPHPTMQTEGQ